MSRAEPLSRRVIWRKVAESYDARPVSTRGMCSSFNVVAGLPLLHSPIYRRIARLGYEMGATPTYWWPCDAKHAPLRATFAALMAAMTDRERDQLEPGL